MISRRGALIAGGAGAAVVAGGGAAYLVATGDKPEPAAPSSVDPQGKLLWRNWSGVQHAYPAARLARWQGRTLDLTGRELAVLEALMAQPNRVLSKAQLQEKLYGWADELESNALEVHVHRLRRKIDPGVVRTVRGVGYALGSGQPAAARAGSAPASGAR